MQEILQCLNPCSSASNLSVLERQRARLQRQQSFESMNEINNLSFDNLISLPISPQNIQTDHQYFCSDSSLKNKKGGSLRKRKAGKTPTVNSGEEEEKEKKMKPDDSPEKFKESGAEAETAAPPLKRDFIHVRARRGQATDSHSLAERVSIFSFCGRNSTVTVRRERISERMKYLQGLVPGCNKITGKAGMLDEIINYVQSLQRQVEFLSMKLATVNPWIDFNIDSFLPKEVNLACNSSIPTVSVSTELVEPNYIQMNPMHQMATSCGLNIDVNFSDLAIRQSLSSPLTVHDTFLDPSFNVHSSSWDANSQNICDLEFHQLPLQAGYSPYNLKMEM
ncbi:hypothetical protein IEQ34_003270 [Dendrobium chrysotoxum]|uniref:BHLH domain-containing protein n=1 Tax=Dendrobium chrysotoxum TaxID=161865 RepID=A0AAV7HH72_DENCH|nr:hypothetical protein IEQ34_003270 [Dendrobium chrysotoxum]